MTVQIAINYQHHLQLIYRKIHDNAMNWNIVICKIQGISYGCERFYFNDILFISNSDCFYEKITTTWLLVI